MAAKGQREISVDQPNNLPTDRASVSFISTLSVLKHSPQFIMATTKESNYKSSCKWPICNSSCWQPGEAIEVTHYKWDPLWGMNIEEIEAFATTQICPCHFRLRAGGLAHYTPFSQAHEKWWERAGQPYSKSHIIYQATYLFIWCFMC